MDATYLHCPRCAKVQPIRFEPLLPGEPSLGTNIYCRHCRHLAFTLIKPAQLYCEVCDDVQPVLLERVRVTPADNDLGVLLVCSGCFDGKAVLFAAAEQRDRRENPDLSRY